MRRIRATYSAAFVLKALLEQVGAPTVSIHRSTSARRAARQASLAQWGRQFEGPRPRRPCRLCTFGPSCSLLWLT